MTRVTTRDFIAPALLLALGLIPALGGAARLVNLWNGTSAPEHARFLAAPTPIVIHVLGGTLYSLLGAFQFSTALRLRWPVLHRRAGKLLLLCGLAASITGLWMTAFYPIPESLQGPLLYGVRLVVASAMLGSLVLGVWTILHRNAGGHEAFMLRAYALGQGAGTQAVVLLPWMLMTGESGGLTRDLLMTLAWIINIAFSEWIIRRRRLRSTRRRGATQSLRARGPTPSPL
jgi:hypothetical protein